MTKLYNLLAFANPAWVTSSFPVIRKICIILIAIVALALIVVIMMQSSSSSGGTNALSGEVESYYAQNKGRNKAGRLQKLTIILSSCLAGLTILYFIFTAVYAGA